MNCRNSAWNHLRNYQTKAVNWFQHRRKNHQKKAAKWLRGKGIEIGAFKTPIKGIQPYYVDKFPEFAGERCLVDIYSEPCDLPFQANTLDYVASSHVIEHTANPVAAICEWYRVLRPGGIIYMVVPDKRFTWDRRRRLTSPAHLFDDYNQITTDCDRTHIDEFVDYVDWSEYDSSAAPDEVPDKKRALKKAYHDAVDGGGIINIHFHVFEPGNVIELFNRLTTHPRTRLKLSIVDSEDRFPASNPNGFLIVVRVDKTSHDGGVL